MRTVIRSILVTLAFASLIGLASCTGKDTTTGGGTQPAQTGGTSGTERKNRRIVFVFKVDGLMYGNACKAGAEQATKELKGVSVEYQAPDKAENGKQVEIIQKL